MYVYFQNKFIINGKLLIHRNNSPVLWLGPGELLSNRGCFGEYSIAAGYTFAND